MKVAREKHLRGIALRSIPYSIVDSQFPRTLERRILSKSNEHRLFSLCSRLDNYIKEASSSQMQVKNSAKISVLV